MLSFSYRNSLRILKYFPICPWPQAIGLSNIPKDGPLIYVYNHQTVRVEPLFLALAAPPDPPIRFFVDMKVANPAILSETLKDVRNSVFSLSAQKKWGRYPLSRMIMETTSRLLTGFLTANINRYNFIPVFIHEICSPEEQAVKRRINRKAVQDCLRSLESKAPVAIAPSGGYTHQESIRSTVPTILPSLAEMLQKRGKTLKIVPSVVKERPQLGFATYKRYIADRILPYRLLRRLLHRLGIKRYERPLITVEFLPPVTFPHLDSTKEEKAQFVRHLQQIMYDVLNKD
jgi:1-acyl-sn-glycerol-3-phosphate acyltransferase